MPQKRILDFFGMTLRHGRHVQDRDSKEFLQYKPWKLKQGVEQFNRHRPQRAATAHAAQAIHLSQRIFGIYPSGGPDSILFIH